MKNKTISEWQKELYNTAKEKGWHDKEKEKSFTECLMLVVSELSEALEEYRNGKGYCEIYSGKSPMEGIPVEMADAFIRILDMCEQFKIDLESAVDKKNEYNKTRSRLHGNKKI